MNKDISIDIWENANKIVEEDLDKITETLLENVYYNADRMLYDVILAGENTTSSRSKRDEQVANVISFLGKRGRGKTSAMLSFYSYLSRIQSGDAAGWSEFKNYKENELIFHKLDYIDAAMLSDNEFIIDVILAKMWNKFETVLEKNTYYREQSNYEYLIKNVKDGFVKVRKAYLNLKYKKSDKEIERERDIPAASGLRELAIGINLKESIKQLVEDYIKVLSYKPESLNTGKGYLVIALDDVDMANKEAWNILEQIRSYMSIPRVIILLTADMERLKRVCEACCSSKYLSKAEPIRFVNDYLEKVLPINMRIHMPELIENKNIKVCRSKDEKYEYEKDIILRTIAKNCEIYFSPERRIRHFLQNESLRSLVNYFDKLSKVKSNQYLDWLKNDLQERLIERIEDEEQREFLKKLCYVDYAEINNYLLNYIDRKMDWKAFEKSDKSLGQILYACNLLEEKDAAYSKFVNCVLVLYAIILKENWGNKEIRNKIIGNSIFGEWEYNIITRTNQTERYISGVGNRSSLQFGVPENFHNNLEKRNFKIIMEMICKEQKEQIMAWLYSMLYVNVEIPADRYFQMEINEIDREEDGLIYEGDVASWIIEPSVAIYKNMFGFLYRNQSEYKQNLELLLKSLVLEFYKYLIKKFKEEKGNIANCNQEQKDNEEVEEIFNLYKNEIIDKMNLNMSDVQKNLIVSTEILYSIGVVLGKEERINDITLIETSDRVAEKLNAFFKLICKQLENVDNYYKNSKKMCFKSCFRNALQTRLILEKDFLDTRTRDFFNNYMKELYCGGVLLAKNPFMWDSL